MGICWLLISTSSEELSGPPMSEETWSNTKKPLPRWRKKPDNIVTKTTRAPGKSEDLRLENCKNEVNNLPLLLHVLKLKYNWFRNRLDKVFVLLPSSTMVRNGLNCKQEWGPGEYVHQVWCQQWPDCRVHLPGRGTQQDASVRKLHKGPKWETHIHT